MIDGIILINKEKFITSNKTLSIFKRKANLKKVGMLGILDPLATGVLPLVIGEATKFIQYVENNKKSYDVRSKLGVFSECGDYESEPHIYDNEKIVINNLNENDIKKTLQSFIGDYDQIPPMYSNVKHNGRPLHSYARKNIQISRESKKRQIYDIQFISLDNDILNFYVTCSPGTYIRTLVQDISKIWDVHSCLYDLKRVQVFPFDNNLLVDLSEITHENLNDYVIPIPEMLSAFPKIVCSNDDINKLYNGICIHIDEEVINQSSYLIVDSDDIFHGVGVIQKKSLYPKRLMKRS